MSNDPINRPSHYTYGAVEVIDAIEAWGLDYHRGNVIKYVARAAHKGTELEDLRKARWYLDMAIAQLHAAENGPDPVAAEVEAIAAGAGRTQNEFVQAMNAAAAGRPRSGRFVARGVGEGYAACGAEYLFSAWSGWEFRVGDVVDFWSRDTQMFRGVQRKIESLCGTVMHLDRTLTGTGVLDDDDVVLAVRAPHWNQHGHGFVRCSVCGTLCAENGTAHSRHEAACWSKA